MTGYEIPWYSLDMLDPAFLRCLQDIAKFLLQLPYSGSVACISQLQALSVNYNNANLKTGARWCYYSSICSYCLDSCLPGRNITFNFVLVLWQERYNRFSLDSFIGPFQGFGTLVFELPVKQPITKGGSWIHLCLKEMKICIVGLLFLSSPLSLSIV